MNEDTIRKSGEARAGFQRAADYRGISCCDAQRLHILAAENTQLTGGPSQRQAKPVENGLLGQRDDFRRNVFVLRSEEHTSELQSHLNLVCRLLLEKKK